MIKRFNRIWSIAISLSLLASVPAFGDIPIVPPIGEGANTQTLGPETAGPVTARTVREPLRDRELRQVRELRQGLELPLGQGLPREAEPAAVW